MKIFSLGHSNRPMQEFVEKLDSVNFDYVIDIRSRPYSRYLPHFNKNRLIDYFGDKYIFMGNELGGLDDDISFETFMYGIDRLSKIAKDHNVVFFCSEKDFNKCHRFYKVSPELEVRGFKITHL